MSQTKPVGIIGNFIAMFNNLFLGTANVTKMYSESTAVLLIKVEAWKQEEMAELSKQQAAIAPPVTTTT